MLKPKMIANLKILVILVGIVGSVWIIGSSGSSNVVFSGAVYASPSIPVEGAFVSASGPEGYGSATTDSSGHYSISDGLATGNYTVTVTADGYMKAEIDDVAVTGGLETANLDFLLTVSGAISGTVIDADSALPLENVVVTVVNATGDGESESGLTDANGNYLVNTNLATGTYNVTASYSTGHVTNEVSGIDVTIGLETKNVDVALQKSGVISGTVTDSDSSAPLHDIYVIATSISGGIFGGAATTNMTGQYIIDTNLATGTYNVSVLFPEGYISKTVSGVTVTAGAETTADLALDGSGTISGRVTRASDGQPVKGANVNAFSEDYTYFAYATTNAGGYYNMSSGLGTGNYTVMAISGLTLNMTTDVSVVAGAVTANVDIILAITPSGTITGRVTNSTGSPIEFASVQAEGLAGSGEAQTDDNGNYAISDGLGTGTYNVSASAGGYIMMSVVDISVTIDQVTADVDFQLSPIVSGIISGTVEADFQAIPEFSQPILAFLFTASLIAVALLTNVRNARVRRTQPR